jgi:23S rRNA pseudouridine1911/1915/1917 synthase
MQGIIDKKFYDDRYEVTCGVPEECHDMRIDLFVQLHFPSFTREFVKKKIDKDQVKILTRHAQVKPSTKIKKWDKIYIVCFRENIEDEYWNNEKIQFEDLSILYNHEKFCVANKPPFMCAHPTGRHVFYCATVYAERELGTPCSTVHRLDRETSGVIVLSKDSEYGNLLATQFEKHQVQKFYFFIAKSPENVSGKFPFIAKERIGEDLIPHVHSRLFMHCYPEDSPHGKSAKTYFDLLAENKGYICGLAMPKTGRQHQIRTHAAFHGFPLVGDKIYWEGYTLFQKFKDGLASNEDFEKMILPRHALHATALDFLQLNLNPKSFFAPLPFDLMQFVEEKMGLNSEELHHKLKMKIKEWQHLLKNDELP